MRAHLSVVPLVAALSLAAACADNAPPPAAPSGDLAEYVPPGGPATAAALAPPAAGASPAASAVVEPEATNPVACNAAPSPDFARDVQPIVAHRCLSCHANGGVAADEHDFSRPESFKAAHREIADEISSRSMPPGAPLPPREADILVRWATCLEASR
ncbi:MAG TPA: hypothetical protein VHV30_00920 [Polyangiaceae bacterium]|nr:hypothetical protein [Polyangiaceae bacterium]